MTLLCYCFGHSTEDIERSVAEDGTCAVLEAISAAKRAGGCHCVELNPEGR